MSNLASVVWLILAVILFIDIKKWNKKFGELYDELQKDIDELQKDIKGGDE